MSDKKDRTGKVQVQVLKDYDTQEGHKVEADGISWLFKADAEYAVKTGAAAYVEIKTIKDPPKPKPADDKKA